MSSRDIKISRIIIGLIAVLGLAAGTVTLISSVSSGMTIYMVSALFVYVATRFESRSQWEAQVNQTISTLQSQTETLILDNGRHKSDLKILHSGFATLAKSMKSLSFQHTRAQKNAEKKAEKKKQAPLKASRRSALATPVPIDDDEKQVLRALGQKVAREYSAETQNRARQYEEAVSNLHKGPELSSALKPAAQPSSIEPEKTILKTPKSPVQFSALVTQEIARHSIESGEVETTLQPVVNMKSMELRSHEVYGRITAEGKRKTSIHAAEFMSFVQSENLSAQMDTQILKSCLDQAKAQRSKTAFIFLNLSQDSLTNTAYMSSLLSAFKADKSLARKFVFEIPQALFDGVSNGQAPTLAKIMKALTTLGCRFSLDHVTHAKPDIQKMKEYRVQFMKMDGSILVKTASKQSARQKFTIFKSQLDTAKIGLIAQKIETPEMMEAALSLGIIHGQGYYLDRVLSNPENLKSKRIFNAYTHAQPSSSPSSYKAA